MTTKSKQVAFLLETYLIRDVSKIVYEYLVLEGINKFLCGEPRFEQIIYRRMFGSIVQRTLLLS